MEYDLSNEKERFRFNATSFYSILGLALSYDWIPKGTVLPGKLDEHENWDGEYYTNSMQYVTPEDAFNLAEALERALENIPDLDSIVESITYPQETRGEKMKEIYRNFLNEFGSKESKDRIKKFITFCKAGKGFYIS